ncbi:DUSP3 [Bugula neritina]|uniref:protein-serine/threonine phosphatase n=1 Tax=Bugula neritina TaxID=10212 RepID=A0A7J7JBZ1_BUGNE|nr:DUSP3 [Bugula neritina]
MLDLLYPRSRTLDGFISTPNLLAIVSVTVFVSAPVSTLKKIFIAFQLDIHKPRLLSLDCLYHSDKQGNMDASEALHIKLEELQNFLDYTYAEAIKHSGGKRQFVAVHHSGALVPSPNEFDKVFERIYIGGEKTAKDIPELKKNQITCVINCAQGKRFGQVDTNEQYYADSGISYFGIPGHDSVKFDLSLYFKDAAEYIKEKLETGGVYVHCHQGISRSATVVIAYLMIYHKMTALKGLQTILQKRMVMPNRGFLQQLCKFQLSLEDTTPVAL